MSLRKALVGRMLDQRGTRLLNEELVAQINKMSS